MTRTPPDLPFAPAAHRTLRTPPDPRINTPESGDFMRWFCRTRYSSSSRKPRRSFVKRLVSTKTISNGTPLAHCQSMAYLSVAGVPCYRAQQEAYQCRVPRHEFSVFVVPRPSAAGGPSSVLSPEPSAESHFSRSSVTALGPSAPLFPEHRALRTEHLSYAQFFVPSPAFPSCVLRPVFPSPEHCAPSTCFSLSLPSRVLGPRTSVLIFFSPFTSFTSFTTFTALLTSEAFRTGYSPSLKQRRRSGHQRIRLRVWVPHPRGALQ